MPITRYTHRPALVPADGVTPTLKARARARRERQRALTEIGDHSSGRRNDLSPALVVSYPEIDELHPASRRVRKSDPVQVARIRASIEKFGVCQPVLIDKSGAIVHGHGVVEAARALGLRQVPAIAVEHLSPSQLRLLPITLNRLGETGQWDEQALRLEFEELIVLGEDVLVSGFESAEIDLLLLDEEAEGEAETAEEALSGGASISEAGDLWLLGRHRVLQGDARDPANYDRVMRPGEFARVVLTDPPYNVLNVGHVTSNPQHREFAMAAGEMSSDEFAAFIETCMRGSLARLLDGGLIATFIDWRSVELVIACGRSLGLELMNVVVWSKTNAGQARCGARSTNSCRSSRRARRRTSTTSRWAASGGGARTCGPTQEPVARLRRPRRPRRSSDRQAEAMLEDALLDVSDRDEIVLDPFAGSGSTLLAAEATGRVCRTIEIDSQYCDAIVRRWQAMSGEEAVLEETAETFAAVAARREREGDAR